MVIPFTRFSSSPRISVLVPAYNRPEELRRCLDGFTQQTAARKDFEVVVVDDGSTADLASVAAEFRASLNLRFKRSANGGPGAARNLGLKLCRAPLLLLYDDDLRPYPDVIENCLEFHNRNRGEGDMTLLNFEPDPSVVGSPFLRWAFLRMYPFPKTERVSDWKSFWSGTISCKKSVFNYGLFDPSYKMVEDAELGLRLSRRVDMRIHYHPRMTGTFTRPITFSQFCRRQYMLAYFTHVMARSYRGAVDFAYPPYDQPENYMMDSAEKLGALIASMRTLEKACPKKGNPPAVLCHMWNKTDVHVRANGWVEARDGFPAQPPGTIAPLLEAC